MIHARKVSSTARVQDSEDLAKIRLRFEHATNEQLEKLLKNGVDEETIEQVLRELTKEH